VTLFHHVLLVVAVLALGAAALRAASSLTPEGLERILVAAVLGAACAVAETLLLGLAGVGSSPVALALAAVVTWLGARAILPAPPVGLLDEASSAIAVASPAVGLGVGAAAGMLLVLVVFFLRHPAVGIDGTAHHLPEIVSWVHSGRPGSVVDVGEVFPAGAYPLTYEVLLAWSMGLSRSFVPVALWPSALLGLLAVAGWVGLRRLGVAAGVAALAIVAVAASPALVDGLNTPKNDLATLTWLAVAAALCVAAVKRPPLLAVAVLAGGLSVGTKTTTAPLVVLLLGIALYRSWRRGTAARPAPALLAAAVLAAVAVGGVWYLRNLVLHGSPLWPFVTTPWGDKLPPAIARLDPSFINRPLESLEGRTEVYVDGLAGGLVLMVGGTLAWLLARSRAVVIASVATAFAVLAWARAPFTGIADDRYIDLSLFVLRYLMPAIAVGAVALALASRGRGPRALLAAGMLAAATVWSALNSRKLGYPNVPGVTLVGSGVLAGAVVALAAQRLAAHGPGVVRIASGFATAVVALALAAAAPGYVERHARTNATFAAPVITWFAGLAEFRDGDAPISLSPQTIGPLAGDRLQHDIKLIPGRSSCREVLARARQGFVVVQDLPALTRRYLVPYRAGECLADQTAIFTGSNFRVYRLRAHPQNASVPPPR